MTERLWTTLSGVLLVIAAVFLWRNNLPAAFVTGALGACAWFLGYRTQLRRKIKDYDASDEDNADNIDQE